jgi:hypothetical protein
MGIRLSIANHFRQFSEFLIIAGFRQLTGARAVADDMEAEVGTRGCRVDAEEVG